MMLVKYNIFNSNGTWSLDNTLADIKDVLMLIGGEECIYLFDKHLLPLIGSLEEIYLAIWQGYEAGKGCIVITQPASVYVYRDNQWMLSND
jgi:hypothetical protein